MLMSLEMFLEHDLGRKAKSHLAEHLHLSPILERTRHHGLEVGLTSDTRHRLIIFKRGNKGANPQRHQVAWNGVRNAVMIVNGEYAGLSPPAGTLSKASPPRFLCASPTGPFSSS